MFANLRVINEEKSKEAPLPQRKCNNLKSALTIVSEPDTQKVSAIIETKKSQSLNRKDQKLPHTIKDTMQKKLSKAHANQKDRHLQKINSLTERRRPIQKLNRDLEGLQLTAKEKKNEIEIRNKVKTSKAKELKPLRKRE